MSKNNKVKALYRKGEGAGERSEITEFNFDISLISS